jgi:hypothetical protein
MFTHRQVRLSLKNMTHFTYLKPKIPIMESNQVTSQPVYAPSPGIFGTKIPSTVAFGVAILLFFLPFIDIKCGGMSIQTVSGVQLATGFKMKNNSSDNSFLNDMKTDEVDKTVTKATTKSDDKDPNMYALVALGLGVVGLLLSFLNAKAGLGVAMVTGIGSAAALIGLMLDIKKKAKIDMPSTGSDNSLSKGLNDLSSKITVDFTPWFYVSVIAFLAAAFFAYKRMRSLK